jgi:predicted Zn finger-like uncharacterized protein
MRIACSRCQTKYNIPADKLAAGVIKVRCTKCGHVFGVRMKSPGEEPTAPPPEPELPIAAATPPEPEVPPPTPPEAPAEVPAETPFEIPPEVPAEVPVETPPEVPEDVPTEAESLAASPEEPAAKMDEDFGFGDFDPFATAPKAARETPSDDLGLGIEAPEEPASAPAASAEEPAGFSLDDFDLGEPKEEPAKVSGEEHLDFSLGADLGLPASPIAKAVAPEDEPADFSLDDFDLGDEAKDIPPAGTGEQPAQEGGEEFNLSDFDFGEFDTSRPEEGVNPFDKKAAPKKDLSEEFGAGAGELDLAAFDKGGAGRDGEEPLERVEPDELLSGAKLPPSRAGAEPRLDLRKGSRSEPAVRIPGTGIKRPKQLLPAALVAAVLVAGAFFAYNLLIQPDAAFFFLNPSAMSKLSEQRSLHEELTPIAPQAGAFLKRPGKKDVYVITGWVQNNSGRPRSAIRIRGLVYDDSGRTVGTAETYCGNILGQKELGELTDAEIASRLQKKVGEGFSNVGVEPGRKVGYMVVIPNAPMRIAKYSVEVVSAEDTQSGGAGAKAGGEGGKKPSGE